MNLCGLGLGLKFCSFGLGLGFEFCNLGLGPGLDILVLVTSLSCLIISYSCLISVACYHSRVSLTCPRTTSSPPGCVSQNSSASDEDGSTSSMLNLLLQRTQELTGSAVLLTLLQLCCTLALAVGRRERHPTCKGSCPYSSKKVHFLKTRSNPENWQVKQKWKCCSFSFLFFI